MLSGRCARVREESAKGEEGRGGGAGRCGDAEREAKVGSEGGRQQGVFSRHIACSASGASAHRSWGRERLKRKRGGGASQSAYVKSPATNGPAPIIPV